MNPRFRSTLKFLVPRSLRNWLRSPGKSITRVTDEFRHLIGRDITTEIRPGWIIACHPAAIRGAYFAQVCDPEQIEEFDFFIHSLRDGCILFDIGAHFGLFSFAALHFGGESSKAIAVDPSPEAVRMIRIQATRNQIHGKRLQTLEAAVGATIGDIAMVCAGVGSAGYYVSPKSMHEARDLTTTALVSVDSLVETYGLVPTHLKIDIEGTEMAALRGCVKTLSRAAPIICLELHCQMIRETGADPKDVLIFLADAGYTINHICGGGALSAEAVCSRDLVRLFASKNGLVGNASNAFSL